MIFSILTDATEYLGGIFKGQHIKYQVPTNLDTGSVAAGGGAEGASSRRGLVASGWCQLGRLARHHQPAAGGPAPTLVTGT